MKKSIEPPIGIILTMPKQFFEETGWSNSDLLLHMLDVLNCWEDGRWHFLKKTLPTQDFLYVYLVWDGKVQLRANLMALERNTSHSFNDTPTGETRHFVNKNWIILCAPAVKAPHDIPMKGFQGFRYVTKELF